MKRKLERGDAAWCMANQARSDRERHRGLMAWENETTSGAFCPACAKRRPADSTASTCIPCANAGHKYRIVETEQDRLSRIQAWTSFYDLHGYSKSERAEIPHFANLNKMTVD